MRIKLTQRRAKTGEVALDVTYELEELDDFLQAVFNIGATSVEVKYGDLHSIYELVKEVEDGKLKSP
jgi:hypothetical protein